MLIALNTLTFILLVVANGGRHDWAYNVFALILWFQLIPVTWELVQKRAKIHGLGPTFWLLQVILPWVAFSALYAQSLFNPNFETIYSNLFSPLLPLEYNAGLPTTPHPARSLMFLQFAIGLLFMTLSVLLTKTSRRQIRISLNCLFIFGTFLAATGALTKLTGSRLFLWVIEFRESTAFATFFYKNHWAYFALLIAGIGIALFQYTHEKEKETGHIPEKSIAYALCTLLILITIPLAEARGATLAAIPLAVVFLYVTTRLLFPGLPRVATAFTFLLVAAITCWSVKEMVAPQIARSFERSETQLIGYKEYDFRSVKRLALYRDSLKMFQEKPLWGWGIGSFIHIHPIYAGEEFYAKGASYPVAYEFAHSDYMQTLAEKGAIGTALLICPFAILFIALFCKSRWRNPVSLSLLLSGGLVTCTAAIDFTFSNPAIAMGTLLMLTLGIRYALLSNRTEKRSKANSTTLS